MTQVVEQVQPDLVEDDKFEPVHLVCCDPDIAICGEPVPDETTDWVADWAEDEDCVMCAYMCDNGLPCSIPGCPGGDRDDA